MEIRQRILHLCLLARSRAIALRSLIASLVFLASLVLVDSSFAQNPGTWAQLEDNL